MNAFEALSKLNLSNVMAIRGNLFTRGYSITDTTIKSEAAEYGINIPPKFFTNDAKWEVSYVCENCSGTGAIGDYVCPECEGDKMIWSAV